MKTKRNVILIAAYLIITVLFISCGGKEEPGIIELPEVSNTINEALNLEKEIRIDSSLFNIVTIKRVVPLDSQHYVFLDPYGIGGYITDQSGEKIDQVIFEGKGPNEVLSITDIAIDKNKMIYILDGLGQQVKKYNEKFEFKDKFNFSYVHRSVTKIYHGMNNEFILAAERNLADGSNVYHDEFLQYPEMTLLNVYSSEFKYKKGFLTPSPKLEFTRGIFLRPIGSLACLAVYKSHYICATAEGFYTLKIFNSNYKLKKELEINDPKFKNFDIKGAEKYNYFAPNFRLEDEETGHFIAGHSMINDIYVLGDKIVIVKLKAFDNYFPQYSSDPKREYLMDIFKIDNEFNLEPLYSNVELEKLKPVGIDGDLVIMSNSYSGQNTGNKRIEFYSIKD